MYNVYHDVYQVKCHYTTTYVQISPKKKKKKNVGTSSLLKSSKKLRSLFANLSTYSVSFFTSYTFFFIIAFSKNNAKVSFSLRSKHHQYSKTASRYYCWFYYSEMPSTLRIHDFWPKDITYWFSNYSDNLHTSN